jgi:hypothetical protein
MVIVKPLHRRQAFLLCAPLLALSVAHAATKWQQPTQEELTMTSQPEVPGASAVILFRDETVDDSNGTWSYYYRIKILNQSGRDHYSNISIEYPTQSANLYYDISSIAARTIHADGTIVPFTGKPFDRIVERSSAQATREKVFTLPDVQIGSILEYRYSIELRPDVATMNLFSGQFIPTFYAQTELFARKVSFLWHTNQQRISLTSSLPGGSSAVKIKQVDSYLNYSDCSIHLENVMPVAEESHMLPSSSLAEKVVFYTGLSESIHNPQDFWNQMGKDWSTVIDDFIGPRSTLSDAAATITAGASTPEDKLRKLYAAVQQMQNTNFLRELSAQEEKVTGIFAPKSALDVLNQKRGDDLQLTILFVGLARAAGFKAYIMAVTNRDISRFEPQLITLNQLNDDIAIVELNGKDLALDPAEPFCPFGQLLWTHSDAGGLRQTATGVAIAVSPIPDIKNSETRRVANLTIDPSGHESGSVDIAFFGVPALRYRQKSLLDDEVALHQDLEDYLRNHMPKGTDVVLRSIDNPRDADKPLIVHFQVSGPLGNVTGKSSLIPAQLFQFNEAAMFPNPTRTLSIEFSYPEIMHDTVRLQYPPTWQLAAAPAEETDALAGFIGCSYHVQFAPGAIILRRAYILNADSVAASRYTELRNFDDKIASKDHEMILLHTQPLHAPAL